MTLVQLSDAHVLDEESPLRAEPLDRLGGSVASAFRPQEALTAQVLAAALQSADALQPDALLVTGDLVDNAQANELDWAIGTARRRHGDAGLRRARVRRPAGAVVGRSLHLPARHRRAAAPRAAGRRRSGRWTPPARPRPGCRSSPTTTSWCRACVPVDAALAGVADRLAASWSRSRRACCRPSATARSGSTTSAARSTAGVDGTYRDVPADPRRAPLAPAQVVERLAAGRRRPDPGRPAGLRPRAGARACGSWPSTPPIAAGRLRRRAAGERARLARRRRCAAHAGEHLLIASATPLEETRRRRRRARAARPHPGRRRGALGRHAPGAASGRAARPSGGYWLVRAPSLIDYPQALRALRLVELDDGRVALETWLVDHAGDPGAGGTLGLAGISRDLAFLDVQGGRPQDWNGSPADRNARLFLP